MTLPRRAQMILGALGMVLLFGLLGLAWWWWHHRPGYQPTARLHRVRVALVVAGLVIIAVGSAVRRVTVFHPPPSCSPPGGAQPARSGRFDASLLAQETATWPETGVGLLYSWAKDARVFLSRSAYYYVAVHANNPAGANAMTVGDIVLTPGFDRSRAQLQKLIGHEARHRAQWAIWTAIGGPFAFPVAYAIDDFLFPRLAQLLRAPGRTGVGVLPPFGRWASTGSRSSCHARHPGRDHRPGPARRLAQARVNESSQPADIAGADIDHE